MDLQMAAVTLEGRRMTRLPFYGRQGKFTFRLLAITLFGQSAGGAR